MRRRTISPGFFTNEDLIELPPITRLVYIGLWLVADRDGRLEDRPRRLRLDIFPGQDCDVEAMLGQLAQNKFIQRYTGDNNQLYISIPAWTKHQHPHPHEVKSV